MAMSLNQIGSFSGTPVTPDSVIDPPTTTTATAVSVVWRSPPSNLRVSVKPDIDRLSPSPSPPMSPISVACQALVTDADVAEMAETEHRLKFGYESESKGVPVYVMMPLDSVTMGNGVNRRKAMNASLKALKSAGVEGIMMDVWWGLVEREASGEYNWGGYSELLEMAKKNGLKVQAVMSFHQCGGNVGDSCT